VFAATELVLRKKFIPYILLVLVMSTIHATALLMIPICFIVQGRSWNKYSVLLTAAVLVAINFSGELSDAIADFMTDTQYSGEVNQFLQTEGTNRLRVLVFAVPPLLALAFRRYIDTANSAILNLSANMSIISMGAYIVSAVTSGIFIGRIPIYFSLFNYILLPWIIENVFDKRSQRLVYAATIACYLYFYWYQVTLAWKL
jgi:transmembrane protein EpsG